jgi:hypothetical protein
MAWPKTGASPPVEIPITSGERLTIAPNEKSQWAGLSMTLTGTPAARAAAAKRRAEASSSKPPTAIAAPVKSAGCQARSCSATAPRGESVASTRRPSHGVSV